MSKNTDEGPLGLFGGTFDPIHLGHTGTVNDLMAITGLDDIRFIPSATPPHRDRPGASADHRLAMTRLATADLGGVSVDSRELERDGPSYTVDTLRSIQTDTPTRSLCLITGVDALLGLPDWYQWQEVQELASILVMVRPGYALPEPLPDWWLPDDTQEPGFRTGTIRLVPVSPNPISATAVRQSIAAGDRCDLPRPDQLLHPDVWQYIQHHRLYQIAE